MVQNVDRINTIAVDVSFPNALEELRGYCAGVVNQYAKLNTLVMRSEDLMAQVKGVEMTSGFQLYWLAYQTTGFPAHVLRALRIGVLTEQSIAAAGIGIPIQQMPAAQVQQFNAQGVVFLDWDRRTHDMRFATFLANVQMPMAPVYEHVFKMVEVAALANLGGTGQTVVRSGYETVVGVHKIGADQLDLGVLLAGEKSGVLPAAYPLSVQHSQAAVDHKNLYVRGMFKAGQNKS